MDDRVTLIDIEDGEVTEQFLYKFQVIDGDDPPINGCVILTRRFVEHQLNQLKRADYYCIINNIIEHCGECVCGHGWDGHFLNKGRCMKYDCECTHFVQRTK